MPLSLPSFPDLDLTLLRKQHMAKSGTGLSRHREQLYEFLDVLRIPRWAASISAERSWALNQIRLN